MCYVAQGWVLEGVVPGPPGAHGAHRAVQSPAPAKTDFLYCVVCQGGAAATGAAEAAGPLEEVRSFSRQISTRHITVSQGVANQQEGTHAVSHVGRGGISQSRDRQIARRAACRILIVSLAHIEAFYKSESAHVGVACCLALEGRSALIDLPLILRWQRNSWMLLSI